MSYLFKSQRLVRTSSIGVALITAALTLSNPASTGTVLASTQVDYAAIMQVAPPQPFDALQGAILHIPIGQIVPKIDGVCDDYSDAITQPFADGANTIGKVYLKHDGSDLYVCVVATPGHNKERFESLYLDPQGDGNTYTFAASDDYALHVNLNSANSSFHGTGVANGYVTDAAISGFWNGSYALSPTGGNESFEYRLSIGRFKIGDCDQSFGIAAYHHWFDAVGDDYGFPSKTWFDQPSTWALAQLDGLNSLPGVPCGSKGKIAYVFRGNTADATSYRNFLISRGYSVDLIPLSSVLATDFSVYDLTMIADDSGSLNDWGLAGFSAAQVTKITTPNKPIMGLGEGGYAFFGQPALSLFIGWPQGWHGPADRVAHAPSSPPAIYTNPNAVAPDPVHVFGQPVNHVAIYQGSPPALPAGVIPVGDETPSTNHSTLIFQDCRFLWGFGNNPSAMTGDGRNLLHNYVEYALHFQCPPPRTEDCLSLSKTAVPPDGATVQPNDVIQYTLTYTMSNAKGCQDRLGKLVDVVPTNTIFVPGSASDGIAPAPDRSLTWVVGPALATPVTGTKSFKVIVSDSACREQLRINNQATLSDGVHAPVQSNVVSHPVKCPPIGFPNDKPPYAEDEVQIHPYPIVAGHPSEIKVRLTNNTPTATTVLVSFQTSPDKFGIGLSFNTIVSKSVTIPANGHVVMTAPLTLLASGHYCIQIRVDIPGYGPIFTQRNLDVTEDLKPGIPDTLTFAVGNPTASLADIALIVDNTCPGFNAIVSPTLLTGVGPNDSDIRSAQLIVTPPNPVNLGSGCHIDVQGWLVDAAGKPAKLLGGIRKLDVPPVRLPENIQPSWLEPEISVKHIPIQTSVPNSICIELQNPLNVTRVVTLEYAVADFGAGIPFTPVGTKVVQLPPNSIDKYCLDWTPANGGTLHRCILVTLKQLGYKDQRSQHNLDLVRGGRQDPTHGGFITFTVGNPDLVTHTLKLDTTVYGIHPFYHVVIRKPGPIPDPPLDLGPGQQVMLEVGLLPAVQAAGVHAPLVPPDDYRYGDESRVDVSAKLDGVEVGGFTVQLVLEQNSVFLPVMMRQ